MSTTSVRTGETYLLANKVLDDLFINLTGRRVTTRLLSLGSTPSPTATP